MNWKKRITSLFPAKWMWLVVILAIYAIVVLARCVYNAYQTHEKFGDKYTFWDALKSEVSYTIQFNKLQ